VGAATWIACQDTEYRFWEERPDGVLSTENRDFRYNYARSATMRAAISANPRPLGALAK
jgi:hypothetical protein